MKKLLKRVLSGATVAGLLCSMGAALAAEPATVHAVIPMVDVYHESQNAYFYNEDQKPVTEISYHGTIYIPVRTAGEWMGKNVAWDQTSNTVSLTGSATPVVRGMNDPDAVSLTKEEADARSQRYDNGMDVQLRPDISVTVDGQKQNFVNANGESVSPIAFYGTTYLPVRSIGELCGKTVTYSQAPDGNGGYVYIRAAMTDAEKAAVQSYLDQASPLIGELGQTGKRFVEVRDADSTSAELLTLGKSFVAGLTALKQLPKPSAAYFDAAYAYLQARLDLYIANCGACVSGMESGTAVQTTFYGSKVPDAKDLYHEMLTAYVTMKDAYQQESDRFQLKGSVSEAPAQGFPQ